MLRPRLRMTRKQILVPSSKVTSLISLVLRIHLPFISHLAIPHPLSIQRVRLVMVQQHLLVWPISTRLSLSVLIRRHRDSLWANHGWCLRLQFSLQAWLRISARKSLPYPSLKGRSDRRQSELTKNNMLACKCRPATKNDLWNNVNKSKK